LGLLLVDEPLEVFLGRQASLSEFHVLVAFQWVSVAGELAVPSMALVNYVAYRSAYRKLALET
jgi:hypothetical protein